MPISAHAPTADVAPAARARHNLSALLVDATIERHGADVPALAWDGGRWTFGELSRRVDAAAAWWADTRVKRGDIALLALEDGPGWVALFLGAQRLGIVCALVSPALPAERLRDAAVRLDPAVVVCEQPRGWRGMREVDARDAGTALGEAVPAAPVASVRRDDPAYLLLTSGSTGPSKWAVHTAGDIAACVATYGARVLRLRPGDVTWSVAALPTSYGLGNSCYFPLAAGACAALAGRDRSPGAAAAACARHGVTALFGVPTAWARLARHVEDGRVPRDALRTVRLAVSAGEDLPGGLWRRVEAATGLRLVNSLGSSEFSNLYLSDRPGTPRPGTVGWVVPGYELRIDGPPGEDPGTAQGELLVRGPTSLAAYHGQDGATDAQGWFRTGDIVRRERDGSHTFCGRSNDRFKAGALWVDPARVRAVVDAQPHVARSVVMPVLDRDGLHRVGVAVEASADAPPDLDDRVVAAARAELRTHEVPRVVVCVAHLPTAASGKVDRAEIRRRLGDALHGTSPTQEAPQ